MPSTPLFPAWRARFANLGRHAQQLRQHSLLQLDLLLAPLLPAGLLSQTDEGPNSRERVYTVRRTLFGFLFQVLKPACACREIVCQILALRALDCPADASRPGTSAYCQARLRLPMESSRVCVAPWPRAPNVAPNFGRSSASKSLMAPA